MSRYGYSISRLLSPSSANPLPINDCDRSLKPSSSAALDDKQKLLTEIISNDSGISFDSNEDENILVEEKKSQFEYTITEDVRRASLIPDDDKKFFCENTIWAWHGEFARLIMAMAMSYHVDYFFLHDDDRWAFSHIDYAFVRHDNAKAQFQCNHCGYCWTSMRSRCSFYVSTPNPIGLVFLKLYTQQCQYCYSIVHPLWYFDEICRVMKNLAEKIYEKFFPNSFESIEWDLKHDGTRSVRRLYQRKGQMHAQHNQSLCEACRAQLCYF